MTENELARIVFNKGLQILQNLGPGLFENIYEEILYHELKKMGLNVDKQKEIDLRYNDLNLKGAFKADLIINNKLLVELKSVKN